MNVRAYYGGPHCGQWKLSSAGAVCWDCLLKDDRVKQLSKGSSPLWRRASLRLLTSSFPLGSTCLKAEEVPPLTPFGVRDPGGIWGRKQGERLSAAVS